MAPILVQSSRGRRIIIIYDPSILPPFLSALEQAIVPMEAAIATIEIKSRITREGVVQSAKNQKSISRMATLWKYENLDRESNKNDEKWKYPFHSIFALDTDLTAGGKSEWDRIEEVHKGLDLHSPVIRSICVAGRGAYFNHHSNDFSSFYMHPEGSHDVVSWLMSIVEIGRLTHKRRTNEMSDLYLTHYFCK